MSRHNAVFALRGILAAWAVAFVEGTVALFGSRREISSIWEFNHGVAALAPTVLPLAAAGGLVGSLLIAWLEGSDRERSARNQLTAVAAFGAAIAAWSVGGGRHLADPLHRGGLAVVFALLSAGAVAALAPHVAKAVRYKPQVAASVAAAVVLGLELVNEFVLVRLYPGFHAGLAVAALLLAPSLGWFFPLESAGRARADVAKNQRLSVVGLAAAGVACLMLGLFATRAAKELARYDNFRLILLERSPLLGQGVRVAALLAPPEPLAACNANNWNESCPGPNSERPTGAGFSLRDSDILLITVDALRADHVGAYGYSRKTTPNIDRLAADAVRFNHAYAPTAHTSYSVTSLMTGKYMRPLLLQGAGADSDTWATLLRRYGYRTAAFYPPAVFFIDPQRFEPFQRSFLGFEYRKVEFLEGTARATQVTKYLDSEPAQQKLFVWVHLFAPHEPYEAHDGFDFGNQDVDRYDSEIAFADAAVGRIVDAFLQKKPNSLVVFSADHGEEFGDHGGRYHGTTVYEEQVRVPLLVRAPQLFKAHVVEDPVQSIDLLPTVLSALEVPLPPRMRGRNIGSLLVGATPAATGGLALAETEEQVMLAESNYRLICARQIGACQLFDIVSDPAERADISGTQKEKFEQLRRRQRELSASHGQYEAQGLRAEGKGWPNAILRGVAGDGDAAEEIASLLDDADTAIRRKAAELLFELNRPTTASSLRLALTRDEDPTVRAWSALALTRLGQGAPLVYDLLASNDLNLSRLAALALADSGDPRGVERLIAWWRDAPARNYQRSKWLLSGFARLRAKSAVPALIASLSDVRLRPDIAQTLADIGDETARGPLVHAFAEERYQNSRVALIKALARLGAREEVARPLLRFLGVPDPIPGGLGFALQAKVLQYVGGPEPRELQSLSRNAGNGTRVTLMIPRGFGNKTSNLRCIVRVMNQGTGQGQVRVLPAAEFLNKNSNVQALTLRNFNTSSTSPITFTIQPSDGPVELSLPVPSTFRWAEGHAVAADVIATTGIKVEAIAVVPMAPELPPPPPEPWAREKGPNDTPE